MVINALYYVFTESVKIDSVYLELIVAFWLVSS